MGTRKRRLRLLEGRCARLEADYRAIRKLEMTGLYDVE